MLKEIVYWIYYLLSKNRNISKEKGLISDIAFIVSLHLLANIMSVAYIIEYFCETSFLHYLPVGSKWEISSWVYTLILLVPFLAFVYVRYLRRDYLLKMDCEYKQKTHHRLFMGKTFFVAYSAFTWIGFVIILYVFQH